VGDKFDKEALDRALRRRIKDIKDLPRGYHCNQPLLVHCSTPFENGKEAIESIFNEHVIACSCAINWSFPDRFEATLTTNGKKLGFTKKCLHSAKARSLLCKKELFERFKVVIQMLHDSNRFQPAFSFDVPLEKFSYYDAKQISQVIKMQRFCSMHRNSSIGIGCHPIIMVLCNLIN